ncbi:MAG: MFS transporter [Clostridiales Family XIII bacterium]|nr:MFS transporter [Clostridia bacterium]MDY3012299.1 MFS transporter [Clostridiales Family XIII bacterium]
MFSLKEKIRYGVASLGDTAVYNLLVIYALFFMTDIAGVETLAAGHIIFISTIWNAFSIGLIGYLSDRFSFAGGRRLPYMKASIMPMSAALVMMFTVVKGSALFVGIYYTVVMSLLMTAHSFFMIPYEALGADMTTDSGERTSLRSYARFFMGLGNLTSIAILLPLVKLLQSEGLSQERAWQASILGIAVLSALSQIATCRWFSSKTTGLPPKLKQQKTVIKEYWEVFQLKPMRLLLAVTLLVCIANVFSSSSIAYFMKYNLSISEESKSVVFAVMTGFGILMTPILSACTKKGDKRIVMAGCYIGAGILSIGFGIFGINSLLFLCLYIIAFTIGSSAYWQLIYPMLYDISEVDEYQNHRRREATILSLSKIILKVSNACATQLLAGVLFFFGYEPDMLRQSRTALWGIQISLTVVPGILFLTAAVFVLLYPISKTKHEELIRRLRNRC